MDPCTPQEPPPHVVQWRTTWYEFNRALRSPQPFDQWHWLRRLFVSSTSYLYGASGLEQYRLKQIFQSFIPAFGLGLVAVIWWSYLSSLRPFLRQESWRCDTGSACAIDTMHTSFIAFAIIMIVWHYMLACFTSPGVVLPKDDSTFQYKASDAQGGFCCFNPRSDAMAEKRRVALYGTIDKSRVFEGKPSPNPSYCDKCDIVRPPRCHHCKVCNRCTLQFDHHCPWLNNCIGINNHRSFLLLIIYIVIATGHGVALLAMPFYKTIRNQIQKHGFRYFCEHGTGFLDIPMPQALWKQATTTGIDGDTMLRMIFPLLAIVFGVMVGFCGMHLFYVLTARTTMEHQIMLYIMKDRLLAQQTINDSDGNKARQVNSERASNPFNQGWKGNLYQVFGPNLLLVLLPIPVSPVPPYVPCRKED